jgi:hypothetical protein
MPASEEIIIRKPLRRYPLPIVITDLNEPRPEITRNRYARVDRFTEGYEVGSGDNPTIVRPGISKSDLLSKM